MLRRSDWRASLKAVCIDGRTGETASRIAFRRLQCPHHQHQHGWCFGAVFMPLGRSLRSYSAPMFAILSSHNAGQSTSMLTATHTCTPTFSSHSSHTIFSPLLLVAYYTFIVRIQSYIFLDLTHCSRSEPLLTIRDSLVSHESIASYRCDCGKGTRLGSGETMMSWARVREVYTVTKQESVSC